MSFIPDTTTLIQFAIATVILAITPGPDMTLFVSRTLSQGRATGFASMAGALCGTLIHTTLVVVGVSALIVASPMAFFVLKIFGAGYLVFLASMFIVLSIPVTAPMVLAAEKFSAAMKASPRVTRVVDYLFAGVFSAFALKILTAQAK
ncbi:threonine/homoserine/homoserine lactone efflux protein [Mesorhizobium sp. USDA 4775]